MPCELGSSLELLPSRCAMKYFLCMCPSLLAAAGKRLGHVPSPTSYPCQVLGLAKGCCCIRLGFTQ